MKKIILLLFCTFWFLNGNAQTVVDSVILNNGMKSVIKVVAIESSSVSYSVPGDASNMVYSISKSEIKRLYLNTDLNKNISVSGLAQKKDSKILTAFSRNLIGFNLSQMVFTNVSLNYEHIIKEGTVGIRCYAGGNLNGNGLWYQYNNYKLNGDFIAQYRKFTGGIELNMFPFKQRKGASYYVGPAFQIGVLDVRTSYHSYPYNQQSQYRNILNTSFVVNNGMLIRPSNNFFLDLNMGLGIQRLNMPSSAYIGNSGAGVRFSLQFVMGYSF